MAPHFSPSTVYIDLPYPKHLHHMLPYLILYGKDLGVTLHHACTETYFVTYKKMQPWILQELCY